jgi:hypothetical protein
MRNNICTYFLKVAEVTIAANDFYYDDVGYDDDEFPCGGCFEDHEWCTCDQEA